MFEARLDRPRPHLDDKVLTAWNGLMIAAFARRPASCRRSATTADRGRAVPARRRRRAASFIRDRMWHAGPGTLLRRYRDGARRDRRLRGGLRVSDLRAARAVSGRRRPGVARVGDRAAAPAGRAVLGRGGRRLVQHHRPRSERAAADEGGLRRRRADGELGVGDEPAERCRTWSRTREWSDRIERTLRLFGAAARADGPRRADDGRGAVDVARRACSKSSSSAARTSAPR